MASVVFIVDSKGEEVVARHFRSDVPKTSMDAFRNKIIAAKLTGQAAPVSIIEGSSFAYIRHKNLYIVAATRANPNVLLMLEYLFQLLRILKAYLGPEFEEETLQGNFTLIYELFDETMDYGQPQTCAIDVLKLYINNGSAKTSDVAASGTALTSQITGAIDWRREGIRYRTNEVYIECQETVTLQTSVTGAVLRADVNGRVMMKALLTGMPECKFGLNDKINMEKEGGAATAAAQQSTAGVEIDDCTFHRCVRLGKFDTERTITFIPPDGEFELMRYRVQSPSQPFKLLPNITEEGKTKLLVSLKIGATFGEDKKATNIVIKIPVPPTTAGTKISVGKGRARYEPGERAIVWRISSFQGESESMLDAVVDLLPATREKPWVRPPISMDFQVPMYSASGVQVRFLKVYEKSSYQTNRYVKYLTKSGEYTMRF